jgi:hypothetical protein
VFAQIANLRVVVGDLLLRFLRQCGGGLFVELLGVLFDELLLVLISLGRCGPNSDERVGWDMAAARLDELAAGGFA